MIHIVNLTQHKATPEQIEAGVIDPPADYGDSIKTALTFNEIPSKGQLRGRAVYLSFIARKLCHRFETDKVMIGGAPFFMSHLEQALRERGMQPVYAFSKREVVEEPQPDGSVRKVAVFRHLGFVEP